MDKAKKRLSEVVDMPVFAPATIGLILTLVWSLVSFDTFSAFANKAISFVKFSCGSLINIVVTACVFVSVYLLFSKKGDIVIGGKDAKADMSMFSYFAMSLTGVIGAGLVFWGTAEPLTHFMNPPALSGLAAGTATAAVQSMGISFTHWSFHCYGMFTVAGLTMAIAIYTFRLPERVSSIFYPVLGDRIYGKTGKILDFIIIFTYIWACATTFCFAALQLSGGLEYMTGITATKTVNIIVVLAIAAVFIYSSVSGIKHGVKHTAEFNFAIYIILLVFTLVAVNPRFTLDLMTDGIANYLDTGINHGLSVDAFLANDGWNQSWTTFYWTWDLATTLVTSLFLAKISRGRTVRQFVLVNLVLPSLFAIVWFGVFGGSAIYMDFFEGAGIGNIIAEKGTEYVTYDLFSKLPLPLVTMLLFFFAGAFSYSTCAQGCVTAAASMCQKVDRIGNGQMSEPPVILKVTYGLLLAGCAVAVMLLGGASEIQAAAVAMGLPAAILMAGCIVCLFYFLSPKFTQKQLEKIASYEQKHQALNK